MVSRPRPAEVECIAVCIEVELRIVLGTAMVGTGTADCSLPVVWVALGKWGLLLLPTRPNAEVEILKT